MSGDRLTELLTDLAAESAELDQVVTALPDLAQPTPAPGWTVAHQISHLAWTDAVSVLAVTDPIAFHRQQAAAAADPEHFVGAGAEAGLAPAPQLLAAWRSGRQRLTEVLPDAPRRIPWFGVTMSPTSMATGRLMETWAHAQDVADALGLTRGFTPRLRHIAYLGWRTYRHSFAMHGREVPATDVHVALSTPDGARWTFGPADAPDRLTGPALDFCLLVTQRRHPADLALHTDGPLAAQWLQVAQAFAGLPGAKRGPT
jgi:uncharacterized protein (TIGR03084 family)